MNYEEQVDKIRDITKSIELNKITVLTGKNGCGKSLVRKLVGYYLADKLGLDRMTSITSSTSLQQRTETRSDFGAFCSIMHDDPTSPSSLETFSKIEALIKLLEKEKRYLIIDEPELGMGEELIMTFINWFNNLFAKLPENCYGVLIITHSKLIVNGITSEFRNFENMTKEEWLNRKIIPIDLVTFKQDSSGLYDEIQKQQKEKK